MKFRLSWIVAGGLCLYLATALVNIGVIALDDYGYGVETVVPAHAQSMARIVETAGIRSPIPTLFLWNVARVAQGLGIDRPDWQYRFVLLVIGAWSFLLVMGSLLGTFALFERDEPDYDERRRVAALLAGFFFLCPLFLTRALIEALSAPYLMVSAYFLCVYWKRPSLRPLACSVVALAIASIFRFQTGVCFAGLLMTVVLRRRLRDLVPLAALGGVLFLAIGWTDQLLRGGFHQSLRAYVDYNLHHASDYGVTPFYVFLALFLGLTLPPAFVSRYRGLAWKHEYGPLTPILIYFLVFVGAHSAIAHKEERFMVPALPLFLALLTPLAVYLWSKAPRRKDISMGLTQPPRTPYSWHAVYFWGVNTFLLVLVSFNVAQRNTIDLVLFLGKHPEISSLLGVDDTLIFYPRAYARAVPEPRRINAREISQATGNCKQAVAVRASLAESLPELNARFQKVAEFPPGLLEGIVVKLNPKRNARRGAIALYRPKGCG